MYKYIKDDNYVPTTIMDNNDFDILAKNQRTPNSLLSDYTASYISGAHNIRC